MEFTEAITYVLAFFGIGALIGFVAPMAGVGGGVLFTPLMLAFTNLNTVVVRATGLALVMMDATFAGTRYLKAGATRVNFALFAGLFMAVGVVIGATWGIGISKSLGATGDAIIRLLLGIVILSVFLIMLFAKAREIKPTVGKWGKALGLWGKFYDPGEGREVEFAARRIPIAAGLYMLVGFISGAFGLGAGWALTPINNLVLGLPLKVAIATTVATFIIADAAGLVTYMHEGGTVSYIMVPVMLGAAVGATFGSKVALKAKPKWLRYLLLAILAFAAYQLIQRGLQGLGII